MVELVSLSFTLTFQFGLPPINIPTLKEKSNAEMFNPIVKEYPKLTFLLFPKAE